MPDQMWPCPCSRRPIIGRSRESSSYSTESRFIGRLNESFATQSGVKPTCRHRSTDAFDPERHLATAD
jgi:hypothetical protein